MDHTTDRLKPGKRNTSGETLVETLVAFAVLMVLLSLVTTAVKAAASMNSHAVLQMNSLETAGLAAETGGGSPVQGEENAALTLTLPSQATITFTGPEGNSTKKAELPLSVMQAGEEPKLIFFTEGGGG